MWVPTATDALQSSETLLPPNPVHTLTQPAPSYMSRSTVLAASLRPLTSSAPSSSARDARQTAKLREIEEIGSVCSLLKFSTAMQPARRLAMPARRLGLWTHYKHNVRVLKASKRACKNQVRAYKVEQVHAVAGSEQSGSGKSDDLAIGISSHGE
jgi:hypothetical protein